MANRAHKNRGSRSFGGPVNTSGRLLPVEETVGSRRPNLEVIVPGVALATYSHGRKKAIPVERRKSPRLTAAEIAAIAAVREAALRASFR